MRFKQLDHIVRLEPGVKIEAICCLHGTEDYLADHFPRFPVMPGVLMLEALFQAAALLVRATDNYRLGLVLLREAKNVKFSDFVQPGEKLMVSAEIIKQDEESTIIKATGTKMGSVAVSARLVVDRRTIEGGPELTYADRHASHCMRELTQRLMQTPVPS